MLTLRSRRLSSSSWSWLQKKYAPSSRASDANLDSRASKLRPGSWAARRSRSSNSGSSPAAETVSAEGGAARQSRK